MSSLCMIVSMLYRAGIEIVQVLIIHNAYLSVITVVYCMKKEYFYYYLLWSKSLIVVTQISDCIYTHLSSTSVENLASDTDTDIQMILEHAEGEVWYF